MPPDLLLISTQPTVPAAAAAVVAAIIAVGVGLLLLGFGRRLLRPAFLGAGSLLGAGAGYILALAIGTSVPAWSVGLAGAIVMAVVAWASYRPVLGISLALLLGLVCPIALIAWAEARGVLRLNPPAQQAADADEAPADADTITDGDARSDMRRILDDLEETWRLLREADNALEDVRRYGEGLADRSPRRENREVRPDGEETAPAFLDFEDESPDEDQPNAQELRDPASSDSDGGDAEAAWIQKLNEVIDAAGAEFAQRWENAPSGLRKSIVLSAGCGALLGLFIGLWMPTIAASLVTSLAGSGLTLAGVAVLSQQFGFAAEGWMPRTAVHWLTVWVIIAVIGIAIQWTAQSNRADKTQSEKPSQ